jgi:hypothetical protein
MAQFDYKHSLNAGEIRLLKLAWGEETSDLVGRLFIRTLEVCEAEFDAISNQPKITHQSGNAPKAEEYAALSYPWGVDLLENRESR